MCLYVYAYITNRDENGILNVEFWTETNSNQEIQNSGLFFSVSWHDHKLKTTTTKSYMLGILVSAECELLISLVFVSWRKRKKQFWCHFKQRFLKIILVYLFLKGQEEKHSESSERNINYNNS